jgi:Zn-dependent M28 family amino/carboxypeptidase
VQEGPSVNVAGIIPGSELPDEYVVLGAHYDGLGDAAGGGAGCNVLDPADTICNGAADNATGVATVLAVATAIAESGPPRRSLLIAFWDREEDGLIGSADFLAQPVVPVTQMVAYLNFDIQGANLLPSLRETTVMVGAETGGPALVAAADLATQSSTLQTVALSVIFGQGRSDHANFVSAGVPSVFFTDANNGCYHTTRDDLTTVDFAKLDQQIATALALTDELLTTEELPVIVPDAPVAAYTDAVAMLAVVEAGQPDVGLLASADQIAYEQYVAELQRIVGEGEAAFDDADVGPLLAGAATLVAALANTECDGYLAAGA